MPRRASSSVHPLWTLGAVAAILAVAIAGGYFLYSFVSDPFRTLEPLDISSYLENSNSMQGNVYKLKCVVDNQLQSDTAGRIGRLYSVEADPGGDILPVLVPPSLNDVNIQKGQHFFLKVVVGEKGVLRVEKIQKV